MINFDRINETVIGLKKMYMFVAGVALLGKLWFLGSARTEAKSGGRWFAFIGVLALLNLSEMLIYYSYANGYGMNLLLKFYFIFCVLGPCFGYAYVMADRKYPLQKKVLACLFTSGLVISAGVAFTDVFISGYEAATFPVRAVKGEWFPLVIGFCLVAVALGAITSIHNYFNADREDHKVAFFCAIIGTSVLAFTTLAISGSMILGFDGNGSMFIPLATTVFAGITWYGRSVDLVTKDTRRFNPLSAEAEFYRNMDKLNKSMSVDCIPLREAMDAFEKNYLDYRLEKTRDKKTDKVNKSKAARTLNIERTTLYNKLSKY